MHCAARFVTGNYPLWSTSSSGLVSSLGWCTLEQRRLLNMALLFFKFHNNLVGSQILPEFAANQRCNRRHGLTYRQVQTNLLCYSDTGRKSETDEDLYHEGDNEATMTIIMRTTKTMITTTMMSATKIMMMKKMFVARKYK